MTNGQHNVLCYFLFFFALSMFAAAAHVMHVSVESNNRRACVELEDFTGKPTKWIPGYGCARKDGLR